MHRYEESEGAAAPEGSFADDSAADTAAPQTAVEFEAARAELRRLKELSLREHAELDNLRKRMTREVEQARRFANERLLAALLPVLDSLEAALATVGDQDTHREGLELTLRQLRKVAEDNGLVCVDPSGETFDPQRHQAMSVIESAVHAPDTVVQVHQKGYALNERLLRPALVVVAKGEA